MNFFQLASYVNIVIYQEMFPENELVLADGTAISVKSEQKPLDLSAYRRVKRFLSISVNAYVID